MASVGNEARLDIADRYVAAHTPFILYLFNAIIYDIVQAAPSNAASADELLSTDFTSGFRIGTGTFTVNYWTVTFNTSVQGNSSVLSSNIVNTVLNGAPAAATVYSYGVFTETIGTAGGHMVTCGDFTVAQAVDGSGAPYTLPAGAIQWTLS